MANFLTVYDPVAQRRHKFEEKCKKEIAIFDDLRRENLTVNNFSVLWAANRNAPISSWNNKNEISIIFGDAIRPGSSERLTAQEISKEWIDVKSAQSRYYDGYYCAIHFNSQKGLIIGGDILGMFPIYYYSDGEITLTGSSPELFKYHDSFKPELCIEGLTGMLLTMHSIEGLSLWENVWRLEAGHLLVDNPKDGPDEILQYQMPLSEKYYGISFKRQLELIHEKMGQAVTRHAPVGEAYSLLFSGGLDSRMLAGYLQGRGKDITAITMGKSTDSEMKIAKKAMKALPFKHRSIERDFDDYLPYAKLSARWEQGLHGFNSIFSWGYKQDLEAQNATRVISGMHHDGVLSGLYPNFLHENDRSEEVFSKIWTQSNKWAIPIDDLEELFVQTSYKSAIQIMADKLKKSFYSYSNSDYQRTWCYELFHRGRYHHGGAIWKMSFGAWPVIPIIDSAVLEVMAGLPSATKAERKAQRALVRTYFPNLARIPLDNNTNKPEPLLPTWQFLLWRAKPEFINRVISGIRLRITGPWYKNLYYHRIYDINNAGWKKIRKEAEQSRSVTSNIFNQEKLRQLVPPPNTDVDGKLEEVSGMKSLLGFLLWLQHN